MNPTTALIGKQKKRVSICKQQQRGDPAPSTSAAEEPPWMHQEIIQLPTITVPEFAEMPPHPPPPTSSRDVDDFEIELQSMEGDDDLQSISSLDNLGFPAPLLKRVHSKLSRTRVPVHQASNAPPDVLEDVETCLSVVAEHNRESDRQSHSGILLSPLQLGQ